MKNSITTRGRTMLVEPKASVEAALDAYCQERDEAMLDEPMLPGGVAPHATLNMAFAW
jgi:hypothetical protein